MTNPTLERAARAAADAHAISKDGSRLYADYRETYQNIARAVLESVREPSRLAINTALKAGHEATGLDDILHFPTAFSAAIAIILGENNDN